MILISLISIVVVLLFMTAYYENKRNNKHKDAVKRFLEIQKDREYVWYFADTNQMRIYSYLVHNEFMNIVGFDKDIANYLGEL